MKKTAKNQQDPSIFEGNTPDTDTPQLQDPLKPVSAAESAQLRTSIATGQSPSPAAPADPLFDPVKAKRAFDTPGSASTLDTMGVIELLELRGQIDERLPARKLSDIDLEEELLLQFQRTKAFYDHVMGDDKVPANQRAQTANSCSAILEQLIKLQLVLYSAERVKAIESTLLRVLKAQPEDFQKQFFETYERALAAVQAGAA